MATLEELEQQAVQVGIAEEQAIAALVEGMRTLAVGLPPGSPLGRTLAAGAKSLEPWGTDGRHAAAGTRDQSGVRAVSVMNMASDVIRGQFEQGLVSENGEGA